MFIDFKAAYDSAIREKAMEIDGGTWNLTKLFFNICPEATVESLT